MGLQKQINHGEVSDWTQIIKTWKKFWRIHVPDRIKLVTWRVFHNSLPNFKKEDANHLFFDCWWSKCLWAYLGFKNKDWQSATHWNISDRIWYILYQEDPKVLSLVFMTLWTIWYNRNLLVHGKNALSFTACHLKITNNLIQYEKKHIIGVCSQAQNNSFGNNSMIFFTDGSWSRMSSNGGGLQ